VNYFTLVGLFYLGVPGDDLRDKSFYLGDFDLILKLIGEFVLEVLFMGEFVLLA
jgi:hypothetical protein